jgi:tRNA (mo5U34)-methyltransferase
VAVETCKKIVDMDLANNPEFLEHVQGWVKEMSKKTCYHTLELPGGQILTGIIPVDALRSRLEALQIPADLTGRRVLDAGAASGWNSFELERRGADVMAIDCVDYPELRLAKTALQSRVDYRILDIDELSPATVGTFDYVLFLGVLYHVRHPLLSLEKICAVTREIAFIESFVTDSAEAPNDACSMEFYETDELGGQIDNWFGPTTKCLLALCRSAGFASVDLIYSAGGRAAARCSRRWEPAPQDPASSPPRLIAAVNNRTNDNTFHAHRDEYICVYFRSPDRITRHSIRVEVDGYGLPALAVAESRPGEWQVNLRLPPNLLPGLHTVRLRTSSSAFSNAVAIETVLKAEDAIPEKFEGSDNLSAPTPVIVSVENTLNRSAVLHGHRAERLACFVRTEERSLDRRRVLIRLDDRDLDVEMVIDLGNQQWQINARVPTDLSPGSHEVRVRTANSHFSAPAKIVADPA